MSSPSHYGSEPDDPRDGRVPPPAPYGDPPPPPPAYGPQDHNPYGPPPAYGQDLQQPYPPPPPPVYGQYPQQPYGQLPAYGMPYGPPAEQKSFVVTWLLSLFLGVFGADRFYLGKSGTALLKLFTCGGAGLWYLVDLIILLTGSMRDIRGAALTGYEENKKVAWIVTAVFILISIGGNAG
ncbi:MAG: TM2 domain-containing protein [Intrasporangiaceae bacterium]|nr:TM2 domain-containing protein [Intrasporangiaceae bacterium]